MLLIILYKINKFHSSEKYKVKYVVSMHISYYKINVTFYLMILYSSNVKRAFNNYSKEKYLRKLKFFTGSYFIK